MWPPDVFKTYLDPRVVDRVFAHNIHGLDKPEKSLSVKATTIFLRSLDPLYIGILLYNIIKTSWADDKRLAPE